jgi:hypothetical protein
MVWMNTNLRVQAAIEAWALVTVTSILVLPALAVEPAVASRVHRHTDGERTRTAVVSVRTRVFRSKLLLGKVTLGVVLNDIWQGHARILESRFELIGTVWLVHDFIGVIKAVRNQIPTVDIRYTLPAQAGESIDARRMSTENFVRMVFAVRAEVTN